MVKDQTDSVRENLMPPLPGAALSDYLQGVFYIHHPTDRIVLSYTSRKLLAVEIINSIRLMIHRLMSGYRICVTYTMFPTKHTYVVHII